MSYLDLTVLNDLQASEAQNEKRIAKYGMLDAVKDSTPSVDFIPPSVQQSLATISGSRNAKLPVLKDQSVTVVTTPGFSNIPVNLGESASYYFTAYDVFSGFRLYPASFENNQLDGEFYMREVMKNVLQGCAVSIDEIIETVLESRKTQLLDFTTQVSQGDGTFTFNAGTDTLEINKAAIKDTMYSNLNYLMDANKLGGNYKIITNPAGLSTATINSFKYGNMNDKNLVQFESSIPADMRYESHQIAPGSNVFNGFLFREGSMGVYENFPWDFRNGTMFAGKEWQVSDVELPFTRMRANVYINKEATEANSIITPSTDTNLTMTHFEEMAMWFRFYVVYRYNSDLTTRANDVVKISGLTS